MYHKVVCHQGACYSCAIKAGAIRVSSRRVLSRRLRDLCHQGSFGCACGCGFLKQVKGASTSLRVEILFMAVVTRARGSRSVGASRAGRSGFTQQGQIWVRFMLCKQIRSGFTPCLAGRPGQSVGRSVVSRSVGRVSVGRSQAYGWT